MKRSRIDRLLGGVAGGIAAYTGLDPIIVRVGFVLLGLLNGFGIVLYLILWLLVPVEGTLAADTRSQVRENVDDMQDTARRVAEHVQGMFRN